jgi:SAM-dependent methyltransferase
MTTTTDTTADRELKAKHRAMWASGDYPRVAREAIWSLGAVLVEECRIGSGYRVLDVAAGSGNVAIRAAERGASVVASDLTPELFDAGRRAAAEAGVTIDWEEADAEALPFGDGSFDAVLSCVGVMFAPHHQETADELLRVTRPGGTIGLINWTPEGFIGQLFGAMKPFAAPPAPGAQPGALWGTEGHVRDLFGDGVSSLRASRRTVVVPNLPGRADFREFFHECYGPTIAAYARHTGDAATTAALDEAIDDVAARFRDGNGVMEWEYLLVTATRR